MVVSLGTIANLCHFECDRGHIDRRLGHLGRLSACPRSEGRAGPHRAARGTRPILTSSPLGCRHRAAHFLCIAGHRAERLGMSEPSPDKGFLNAIGPWIIGAVGAVVGWLPGGLNGAMGSALISLVAFVCSSDAR